MDRGVRPPIHPLTRFFRTRQNRTALQMPPNQLRFKSPSCRGGPEGMSAAGALNSIAAACKANRTVVRTVLLVRKRVNALNTVSSISLLRGDPVLTLLNGGSCAEGRFVQPHHRSFGVQFARAAQIVAAIPKILPGFPPILNLAQDHRATAIRAGGFGGAANVIDESLPELGQALARPVQKCVTADGRPPGAGVGERIGCRGH